MAYTTLEKSRIAAGIVGNLNITTASIESKILMADGVINGKISDVYSLPLSEEPEFIKELASQMVSAFILIDEYGKEAQDSDKDGYKRLDLLFNDKQTGILDRIQKKQIKLISDTSSTELDRANTLRASYRPTALSCDKDQTDPDIRTREKFGMNNTY